MADSVGVTINGWLWAAEQDLIHVNDGFIDGRNVKEGYIRALADSWGARDYLLQDPVFLEAMEMARSRNSYVGATSLENIYLIMRYYLKNLSEPGNIVEFGSYRGGSAFFMARVAKSYCKDASIICLDTFKGLPSIDPSRDALQEGQFADIDFDELYEAAINCGLDNINFIKGDIRETAPMVLPNYRKFTLAHIDLDLYDPIRQAYDIVKDHMVPKGYLIFDDALAPGCLGAFQAVEELVISRDGLRAEQTCPHLVFRAP